MVTVPREFYRDQLTLNLILESGNKMEKELNKRIRGSQEERKAVLWYFRYIKERHYEKTIRKHMHYGERK
jgi:hypothetical protein